MLITADRVLTPDGMLRCQTIHIENGVIQAITPAQAGGTHCALAVPGLIEQHVHGGLGADAVHATAGELIKWLIFLQKNGVTRVLSGIYTSPLPVMRRALQTARQVMDMQADGAGGARLCGIHLEGPFISKRALGAMQSEYVIEPSVSAYQQLTEGYAGIIRLVTLAPEVPGARALTEYLCAQGITVQAGHTAATAEEGKEAFDFGVSGITHFFNASTPIQHRKPGILTEALLNDSIYTECICDLKHVHPSALRLIYQIKRARRMVLVSDAVSTTGMPDGRYINPDSGSAVIVESGVSRTEEGALSGGSSLMIQEIRNLISLGISEEEAFQMGSATPARHLGIQGGCIAPGAPAEILAMNDNYQPILTVNGSQTAERSAL